MHWTFPPLLATEVMSVLTWRVTGKAEEDLRPENGATMVAWAGPVRLTEATAADETMDDAIASSSSLGYSIDNAYVISLRGLSPAAICNIYRHKNLPIHKLLHFNANFQSVVWNSREKQWIALGHWIIDTTWCPHKRRIWIWSLIIRQSIGFATWQTIILFIFSME